MPETVRAVISVWIDNYRALYASEHDYLFIARNGGPVRPGTIYAAMRKLTREKLGVAVSPHRFRDAAATYFVQEMPELVTLAGVVLNHAIEERKGDVMGRSVYVCLYLGCCRLLKKKIILI